MATGTSNPLGHIRITQNRSHSLGIAASNSIVDNTGWFIIANATYVTGDTELYFLR